MGILGHIRTVSEAGKSQAIKELIEGSTPDFDFFFLVILSVLMATFGLLENSAAVVIGSMLIAPVLFPVLSLSASVVMSDYKLITRAGTTLAKAFILGIASAFLATLFMGGGDVATVEVLARTEPTLLSIAVAVIAGFAVAYTLVKPKLSATLPGIAVAVALIPPLAVIGIGLAVFNWEVVAGASVFLVANVAGVVFASMLIFSLMDLYQKRSVATRAADLADKEAAAEAEKAHAVIEEEKNEGS
ncbi:MAG: DUF389 domain-containing protein [Candidatus Paceibacteria bacterium]